MQPESTHVLHSVSPQQVAPAISPSPSQHGLHDHGMPASLLPHLEERGERPSHVLARDATRKEDATRHDDSSYDASRLNPRSSSPRNRIEEYENALAQSTPKNLEIPIFEVIKKPRKPDDKSCPIAMLANGKFKYQTQA